MAGNSNTASFSTPLPVVLIGCGRVAEKHLKAISKLNLLFFEIRIHLNFYIYPSQYHSYFYL